jgi:hypothetical protein
MKRQVVGAAVLAVACLTDVLLYAGSASALPYVCYYSPDQTQNASLSSGNVSQTSSVTFQLGRDCSGRIVTVKTKRVDWVVTYTNSPSYVAKEVTGISLDKNGTTTYWSNMRTQGCTGLNCQISMSWLPYVETAYDASAYHVHGSIRGIGAGSFASADHTYLPTQNNVTWNVFAPGGGQ